MDYVQSVFPADLDGDGDIDVLSASGSYINYGDISWYENGGNASNFTAHTITTDVKHAASVFAIDVDGDGDIDVLSASWFDSTIAWYENGGNASNFTMRTITAKDDFAAMRSVFAIDVDGDGDVDVLSAAAVADTVAWYESDGGSPPSFTEHEITTSAEDVVDVFAIDVDGDGDMDVLSASNADTVAWYESDGGSPPSFTTHTITTSVNYAASVFAIDVDGDGTVPNPNLNLRIKTSAPHNPPAPAPTLYP